MILTDMHSHTDLSGDCHIPITEMIQSAKEKGLQYYAVTDHHDLDYPDCGIDFTLNLAASAEQLSKMKLENTETFHLLAGIEFGLQPHLVTELAQVNEQNNLDFILGSCHLSNGVDPFDKAFFLNRSRDEGYRAFFESVLGCVTSMQGFDALGHLDYVIRYWRGEGKSTYDYKDYGDLFDAILQTLIKKDIALEVNTAGYLHKLNQPHPALDVLTRYHQLGGELLTIGSDAHLPQNIASHFDIAEERLMAIGFKSYTTFINRQPHQIGFK